MKRLTTTVALLVFSSITLAAKTSPFEYYYRGEFQTAAPILKNLADNKNSQALYYLAKMNLFGYGMNKDHKAGFTYMQRAAELNNIKAQMYLGAYYLQNKKDLANALIWLKKAADLGNAKAQMYSALSYMKGLGVARNPNIGKRYIIKAAKNGIPMAQFLLAKIFFKSRHRIDKKMGRLWLLKAAKKNYPDAALTYGLMLYHGKNITRDRMQGRDWIQRAAELGNKTAKKVLENINDPEPSSVKKPNADIKPWAEMMALLKKANISITNPKRFLAPADAQTPMPVLPSLSEKAIIRPDYQLVSPADIPMSYLLAQTSRMNYHYQSDHSSVNTNPYALSKLRHNEKTIYQTTLNQAQFGSPQALFTLAQLYYMGYGVKQDKQRAFKLFLKTAKSQFLKSEYMIGLYYLKGWGVQKNKTKALQWFQKAALHGSTPAQFLLGSLYEHNKKDIMRARAMYSLAAQSGLATAQYRLAVMLSSGLFNPTHNPRVQHRQLQTARSLFLKAEKGGVKKAQVYLAYFYASHDATEAQHQYAYKVAKEYSAIGEQNAKLLLAILYDRGIGTRKNRIKALRLYQGVAEKNNMIANFILGSYYYMNNDKNSKASNYLIQAAQNNVAYAQYNLAVISRNNNQSDSAFVNLLNEAADNGSYRAKLLLADHYLTMKKNAASMKKAVSIYVQLARKKDARAELKLGYMLQKGIYFQTNYTKAEGWYQRSAKRGNKMAQYQLGEMYFLGQGMKRNITMALHYFKQSAVQEFSPAMVAIGYIKAVDQFDYQNAAMWYRRAAALGNKQARSDLKLIESYLQNDGQTGL